MKTTNPIRIFISHDDIMDEVVDARRIRNLLCSHFEKTHGPMEIRLGEDLNVGGSWGVRLRKYLKTVDIVAVLLTERSIRSPKVLQEVGMAFALEKPIIPLISARHVLNEFTIALRPDMAITLGDLSTSAGAARFVAAFESAIEVAQAA